MNFIIAFLVGGAICAIGEFLINFFKLTPGHITGLFVIAGALLEFYDLYDKLVKFAGAGALLPITSFGHSLADASYNGALEKGFLGLSSQMFTSTSNGIVFAILISIIIGVLFRPKN